MRKLSEGNVFTDELFLARSCKILTKSEVLARKTTLAKFVQEMRKCCEIVARILQDVFLREFCKSCTDCMNFARFLQNLLFL